MIETLLQTFTETLPDMLSIKGFITSDEMIIPLSRDTKVLSTVLELEIGPLLREYLKEYDITVFPNPTQNSYPDFVLLCDDEFYALDIKSSYRKDENTINGMCLGTYKGYFRDEESSKNTLIPYGQFKKHLVLGVIYDRLDKKIRNKQRAYKLSELDQIKSPMQNIKCFVQQKWKIAGLTPGSGNTNNIGSVCKIEDLLEGKGPFAEKFGELGFLKYWREYEGGS